MSLHEGNRTLKHFDDIGFPKPHWFIVNVEVLHEQCGKSGIQRVMNFEGIPFYIKLRGPAWWMERMGVTIL